MSRNLLTRADDLFIGKAQYNRAYGARQGVPYSPLLLHRFGAPILFDIDSLIDGATGAELPNNATITYNFPAGNTSPQDGVNQSGALATPRNLTLTVTHGSSIVAMTALITGRDVYGATMSELFTITATGTTKTATGKKAFAQVDSIAFTSAGDATANTAEVGHGSVLGLPFRVDNNDLLQVRFDGAVDAATFVPAVTTDPATTTTGDVRGTIAIAGTLDGTKKLNALFAIADRQTKVGAYGVTQA